MTLLSKSAATSAVLLGILVAYTYASGVSQQALEWAMDPAIYASELIRGGQTLRSIIAIDDVFIAAYLMASLKLAEHLARREKVVAGAVLVACGTAALLDLHENHQLLSMQAMVLDGVTLEPGAIAVRSDLSQLKWMLGHLAFACVGLTLPRRSRLDQLLAFALVFVQLPVGAALWAAPEGYPRQTLALIRYVLLISGFALIAWGFRRAGGVSGTGAPA